MIIERRQIALAVRGQAAIAEMRHHAFEAQQPVEIGAADVNAAIGENVVAALGLGSPLGRDANDREVRGAAADVDDQNEFLARRLLLVIERGCDRLVLERDVAKTLRAGDLLQRRLRLGIGGIVLVDEADGPAEHHFADLAAEMGFDPAFQIGKIEAENVGKRHRLLPNIRLLMDQRGAENALQRPHEAAVIALQVQIDRAPPKANAMIVEIEEHGARQRRMLALERKQMGF